MKKQIHENDSEWLLLTWEKNIKKIILSVKNKIKSVSLDVNEG